MDVILHYIITSLAALVCITVMGFTKAYTSYKLGDITVKNMGKVSLNPKKHFEIIGLLCLYFLGMVGQHLLIHLLYIIKIEKKVTFWLVLFLL